MIIKTLVENISLNKNIKSKHGLSLYIETSLHKILFDLGSDKLIFENARKMGINIEDIDIVVISHGHFDHGGALKTFLSINKKAKIYVSKFAFECYFIKFLGMKFNIGLDVSLKNHERIVLTDDFTSISPSLILFSNVTGRKLFSPINKRLYKKLGKYLVLDDFNHEQNLIILENNKSLLVSGCCHNGIINTLDKALELAYDPDYIISGLHLMKINLKKHGYLVDETSEELIKRKAILYTCHCTGYPIFERMQVKMKDKIKYLSCGSIIEL